MPVEIFFHDQESLNYFFKKIDKPTNCPNLPQMVKERLLITNENHVSSRAKK